MIKNRIKKLERINKEGEGIHFSVFINGLGLGCSYCSPSMEREEHSEDCPYRIPDRVIIADNVGDIY